MNNSTIKKLGTFHPKLSLRYAMYKHLPKIAEWHDAAENR